MFDPRCAPRTGALEPLSLFCCAVSPVVPPQSLSFLGLSAAKSEGNLFRGILLCREAIRRDPEDPVHYFHLGKVYLLGGKKHLALHSFRKGLKYGDHPGLCREMKRLGFRRSPVFPFLGRKHSLNRFAGRFFTHLGL